MTEEVTSMTSEAPLTESVGNGVREQIDRLRAYSSIFEPALEIPAWGPPRTFAVTVAQREVRKVRIKEVSDCGVYLPGTGTGGVTFWASVPDSTHHDVADAITAGVNLLLEGKAPRVLVKVEILLEREG